MSNPEVFSSILNGDILFAVVVVGFGFGWVKRVEMRRGR
jgi:hypothetical protein